MAKLTKKQIKKTEVLNDTIDDLELENMSETEIEETVKAFSKEGMLLRKERKNVRYQLYRLRTESEGKTSSDSTKEFKQKFESQSYFDGWRMFGTTWDVAFDDPYRIVHKTLSEQEEWEELVGAFPSIVDGKVHYPDIKVRKKIEKHLQSKK